MRGCDLLQAIEGAAFRYLFGLLINRVGKLLGKRALVALIALAGIALANALFPIRAVVIGGVIVLGIGIWNVHDTVKTVRNVIEEFRTRVWQSFKKLPHRLLDQSLLDCLTRKPECCELFQREVDRLLVKWVKTLKPGWKQGDPWTSSLKWRQMQRSIKREITDSLRECCKEVF